MVSARWQRTHGILNRRMPDLPGAFVGTANIKHVRARLIFS